MVATPRDSFGGVVCGLGRSLTDRSQEFVDVGAGWRRGAGERVVLIGLELMRGCAGSSSALSGDEGADGDPVSADVDHAVAVGGAVDLNGRNRLVGLQGWCCRCGPGGAGAAHGEVLQVFGGQPGGDGLEVLAGVGEVDAAL